MREVFGWIEVVLSAIGGGFLLSEIHGWIRRRRRENSRLALTAGSVWTWQMDPLRPPNMSIVCRVESGRVIYRFLDREKTWGISGLTSMPVENFRILYDVTMPLPVELALPAVGTVWDVWKGAELLRNYEVVEADWERVKLCNEEKILSLDTVVFLRDKNPANPKPIPPLSSPLN